MTEPNDDDSSLRKSLAVEAVVQAFHAAVVRYALRHGDPAPVPWWELENPVKNRLRAAVVAIVTTDRPAMRALILATRSEDDDG